MKPVIILSSDYIDKPKRACVSEDYIKSLIKAGALPFIVAKSFGVCDIEELADDICQRADGLMLIGGGDIEADLFGQIPIENLKDLNRERDEFEIALVKKAIEKDIPIFGICRGAQILNVALGGTLVQDIPTQIENPLEHMITHNRKLPVHKVKLSKESILSEVFLSDVIEVNSVHHQAVGDIAEKLSISATSEDGVIEAVEMYDKPFVLGVQWHPENMAFGENTLWMRLFNKFTDAAKEYSVMKNYV